MDKKCYVFDLDGTLIEHVKYVDKEDYSRADLLMQAKPKHMMALARERFEDGHDVYVLTARGPDIRQAIFELLASHGIQTKNVFCVGGGVGAHKKLKADVLTSISEKYPGVIFYDDRVDNVNEANKVRGVQGQLVIY
jgi:hydroxymethylpyrimidine pyrophosphatase-like HAD family hydrolase